MAQQSSIRLCGASVGHPLDGIVRLVTAALALALAITLVGLLAGGRSSPWTALLSTVAESSQTSAAGVDYSVLNSGAAEAANNDGYVEGLAKALGHDL